MTELTIRRATINHTGQVASLIKRSIKEINSADYPVEEIAEICRDFNFAKIGIDIVARYTCVAFCDEQMCGTAAYSGQRLHALFVCPDHVRKRVGSKLVAHIESIARADNAQHLVVSSSLTAIQFYESLGYAQQAFEPRAYGSTCKMSKTLR